MLCIRPFKPGRPGVEYGCGQCLPCRINRRRMWTARICLEAACHAASAFITLTYSPEYLPKGGTLNPDDLEQFRYRLRYQVGPYRYYYIGEYGTQRNRPHYHGLLFGLVPDNDWLEAFWGKGRTHVGLLTTDSAAYCAGYVTKKMTRKDDERLQGRFPEFARMSRKPGIGAPGLAAIEQWLFSSDGAAYVGQHGDVPHTVRIDGKIFPLGRYLVQRLREAVGVADANRMRYLRSEMRIAEMASPDIALAREYKRENAYRSAQAWAKLRRSLEKV